MAFMPARIITQHAAPMRTRRTGLFWVKVFIGQTLRFFPAEWASVPWEGCLAHNPYRRQEALSTAAVLLPDSKDRPWEAGDSFGFSEPLPV